MKSKTRLTLTVISLACVFLFVGCQRSRSEIWDDTKTAGRYANKGLLSLFGKHGDSREVASQKDFAGPPDNEFVPLKDEDLYRRISQGDKNALADINEDSSIPQSKESPGENGSGIPGIDGFQDPSAMGVGDIFNKIHFNLNDAKIEGTENLQIIDNISAYMKQHADMYVFVEGHCCERGSAAYNLALGTRRANAVRNLLIKNGVNMDHVFTISYGKERPLVMGHDEAALQANRRGEFKLFDKPQV